MPSTIDEAVTVPILVVTGPEGRLKEQFVGIVTLIGRSPDADLCLPDPAVDDLHCLLTQTTAGLVAKDCFTNAGLVVNGERVTETLLNDGDEMDIGPYRLLLRLPSMSLTDITVGEAQQELIQQMAKRVAALENKRNAAIRRAWQYRRKTVAPASGASTMRPPTPFGNPELSKFRAIEAELGAERRRAAALETELQKAHDLLAQQPTAAWGENGEPEATSENELRSEIARLKRELAERSARPEDQEAIDALKDYEQQLNDFRDQLSKDAEDLQQREHELAQRNEEIRIAEEQLQVKIADTEKELAGERARVKREQSQLERMVAECRHELEDMQREAESLERDEKYQRLRSQIRGHRDEKDSTDPPTVSERIQRFLKGLGG
jgi:pSer/pThr/pTyr-binding forkhead associated (FHA) protein